MHSCVYFPGMLLDVVAVVIGVGSRDFRPAELGLLFAVVVMVVIVIFGAWASLRSQAWARRRMQDRRRSWRAGRRWLQEAFVVWALGLQRLRTFAGRSWRLASAAELERATCSLMPLRHLVALLIAVLSCFWINGVLAAPLGSCFDFDCPSLVDDLSQASSCSRYYLFWFSNMDPRPLGLCRS